jgi:hypothetical protein
MDSERSRSLVVALPPGDETKVLASEIIASLHAVLRFCLHSAIMVFRSSPSSGEIGDLFLGLQGVGPPW